jgi:hypothetical protein
MNAVKEIILDKIEHLEALSEPILLEVLDFVSFLEWRLNKNQRLFLTSSSLPETTLEEDTGSFLLGIASSFTSGLSNEDLECLPTDGAENHDRYLYDAQV